MRVFLLATGAVSLATLAECMPTGVVTAVAGWRIGARPAIHRVVVRRDQAFVTSDGVRLSADVYLPAGGRRWPTILIRAPLSRVRLHEKFADLLGHHFAQRGYAVTIQGTRGRFNSGGTYYPLLTDRQDGSETLRWLARQPWWDGRVGTFGGSAFGYSQWAIADQGEAGLRALLVQIASTDHHAFFWPGGAFSLQSALYWARTDRGRIDAFPTQAELAPGLAGFPAIEAARRLGLESVVYRDWASRPARDAYWAAIDGERRPERLAALALLMAGWYDPYLPGQLADYTRIRAAARPAVAAETRLVIGPWTHARQVVMPGGHDPGDYRFESLAPGLPWFDRHLTPPGVRRAEALAPVRLYVMGENAWRDEPAWPLARAVPTSFWLGSGGVANGRAGDGRLTRTPPTGDEPADRWVHDPAKPVASVGGAMLGAIAGAAPQDAVDRRSDVLVYETPPLAAPLEVTGPVRAELHFSTDAPATDVVAVLCDVHPDGTAWNLAEGVLRRSYPGGGAPPTAVTVALWPTSNLFKAGHRIRLQVSSSWWPRFDVHPGGAGPVWGATTWRTANQALHHGRSCPSRLILPVVPR